jgi:hypothetical protein
VTSIQQGVRLARTILDAACEASRRSDIKAYKDERLRTGAKAATINRELSYLGRSLRLGLEHELVGKVIPMRKLREDNARQSSFEHSANWLCREKLPEHQKLLFSVPHRGMRGPNCSNCDGSGST